MPTCVLTCTNDSNPPFSIDDRIYLGEGLFETLKVERSKPCFASLHWHRLHTSAQTLGIAFDVSLDEWEEYLAAQILADKLYNGGIKVLLSGGSAPRGLAQRGMMSQLVFQTFSYTLSTKPVILISSSWLRDQNNPVYQLKSVNYLEAIIARREALAQQADDVLFYNLQQHLTETTCANLFLILDNGVFTAPLSEGVLPGIARSRILAQSSYHHFECQERPLCKSMLQQAQALFICNSLQGIRQVASLDGHVFDAEHPWPEQLKTCLVTH